LAIEGWSVRVPPTRYNEEYIRDKTTLLRCYDDSIAFYRALIEDEGLVQFQPNLDEALAARAEVARCA
jgi:hypothetical protein